MASVSAPGTGSGIDVGALVSQLIAAEAQPTTLRLDAREAEFTAQFTALGQLKGALANFASNLDSVKNADTFESRSISVADESLFSATGGSGVPAGDFSIEVAQLAEAQKLSSVGFADSSAVVGSGTLNMAAAGVVFSVEIPASANTLSDVRDAINGAAGNPGISATLVTVDAAGGGTETRLSLTAANTGTLNTMTVTAVDDDTQNLDNVGLSQLVFDPSGSGVTYMSETNAATDAQIRIDSQFLTSQSNTIDFAIEGITLNLLEASPGTPTTLSVAVDTDAALGAVAAFVQSYNSLRTTITDLTAFDPVTSRGGLLLGDSGVRGISGGLQRELGGTVTGIDSVFSSLSELGIATQTDGTLALDSGVLKEAIDADRAGVASVLSSEEGIATRLSILVAGFANTAGVLDQRSDALETRLRAISDQRETLSRRMSAREESLLRQFSAMDTLVSELQSTSSFLTQQLSALSSISIRDNKG